MDVPAHVFGPLPLIDVQTGRRREQNVRAQDVEGCEGLVALADELGVDVIQARLHGRVVGRGGQIGDVPAARVKLSADRGKDVPIALVVGEDRDGRRLLRFDLSAGGFEAKLHKQAASGVDAGAEDAEQHGEEHAACSRVNIIQHSACLL